MEVPPQVPANENAEVIAAGACKARHDTRHMDRTQRPQRNNALSLLLLCDQHDMWRHHGQDV